MEVSSEKQHAHELIEQLPGFQVATAVRLLEAMLLDPVARAAAMAPPDDEPVTEEELLCFQEAQAAIREGREGTPMEEFLAEFGLKLEDFPLSPEDKQAH